MPGEDNDLAQRARDAKFYLTIGSWSFLLIGLFLLLPTFLFYLSPNIYNALIFSSICYLLIGGILLAWGLGKIFRGKNLTFHHVRSAQIEWKDVRKTAKFLVFVSFFIVLLILPVLIGQSITDIMQGIIDFFLAVAGPQGLYIGVFAISIFGNFTVIFPLPYLAMLLFIAIRPGFTLLDGLILGLMAGFGSAIGETSAWLLGRSQTEALEDTATGQHIMKVRKQVERGYGGLLIFLYAATPLPDDVLLIALGATKYPLWKAIVACFFGKVVLCFLVTIGAMHPFIQPILMEMFGGVSDPISETLYLVFGIAVILLLFFVPWRQYLRGLLGRKETESN